MTTKSKKSRRDYEADLVNGLIELMESGTNPWQRSWRKPVVRATRFRGWSGGRHIDMPCTFVKR